MHSERGLQTPRKNNSREKFPKVSGRYRQYSRFRETLRADLFDLHCVTVAVGDFIFASCFQFNFAGNENSFDSCQNGLRRAGRNDATDRSRSSPALKAVTTVSRPRCFWGPARVGFGAARAAMHGHRETVGGQLVRNRAANAAACAGNENTPAHELKLPSMND